MAVCLTAMIGAMAGFAVAETGKVEIAVVDQRGQPLPCRVHLYDQAGKPQRAEGLPFWRDHFVCPGNVEMELSAGTYRFEIERGPEYEQGAGSLDLAEGETERLAVALARIADLAAEGWYSGDLHVHRAIEGMPLLMRAEDLHVAPVITWWNNSNLWTEWPLPDDPLVRFDGNRYYHVMAGEDEREGGALMYFNQTRPLDIAGSSREYPSPMKFVEGARQEGPVWIDVEKPFWWDVPVWLASGKVDSVGLANNHMCRSRMYESEAWGRPRDAERLPPPRGNGFWTQEIYYHMLNCGLRIPPSAGSASGVLPNPLGYDRVYVHCGGDFTYENWWKGLKAGRSFVTNGPLLLVKANGQLPGHVFTAAEGQSVEIEIDVSLTSRDNVPAVEIIKNGEVERAVPLGQRDTAVPGAHFAGSLGTLTFRESGWFLVRAITDLEHTFRFASTAPYYVEIGPTKRRISRCSAQFFLDWLDERAERVPLKLDDAEKLREVLAYHEKARQFWQDLLAKANAL
jgi:hypothetical protein